MCRKTLQTESKFRGRLIKINFAWCKVLRILTLLSIVISTTKSTILSELQNILGVLEYFKAKFAAALTEGDLQSLPLTREEAYNNTSGQSPRHLAF